jgi:hypothetical protein
MSRMFERYTEKARRVIFFARYEASHFGSDAMETEHLLLGLLREDKGLTHRFLSEPEAADRIRQTIKARSVFRQYVSTSVDLPLSNESKRVLAYAAEEAERLSHMHIGTEHLLLGLLREEKCFGAQLLRDAGVKLDDVRAALASAAGSEGYAGRGGGGDLGGDRRRLMRPLPNLDIVLESTGEVLARTAWFHPLGVGTEIELGDRRLRVVAIRHLLENSEHDNDFFSPTRTTIVVVDYTSPVARTGADDE